MAITTTSFTTLKNGIKVFHRIAGPANGPVILLLHGFPSSSNQFRNIMPLLAAEGYRVVAPDLPGFGFTEIPSELNFKYTFDNLGATMSSLLDALSIKKFVVYIFDYGAPTGLRLALERPNDVLAIVSQNGNAYDEGLEKFWDPLKVYWQTDEGTDKDKEMRTAIANFILTYDATKGQYLDGEPKPENVDPVNWEVDWALMQRPGNFDIQLDLFRSYGSNPPLYPKFQEYFRTSKVPILAIWGKNDVIFPPPGAEGFKKDSPNAQVELWDGGHFLVESHTEELAKAMVAFLQKNGIKG
jgi:pimeloyl-ACP methyl ester carboxylesterase